MIFILLIIVIVAIMLISLKMKKNKKVKIIIILLISICIAIFIVFFLKYKFLNPNWIMKIERSDIDGRSNTVYIYKHSKIVIIPSVKFNTKTIKKLDNLINLDETYQYILNNGETSWKSGYKIELKRDKEIKYISEDDKQIKAFLEEIDKCMI